MIWQFHPTAHQLHAPLFFIHELTREEYGFMTKLNELAGTFLLNTHEGDQLDGNLLDDEYWSKI